MPIFDHSTGFQIFGGNFYEVSGDVHFQDPDGARTRLEDLGELPGLPYSNARDASTGTRGIGLAGGARCTRHAVSGRQPSQHPNPLYTTSQDDTNLYCDSPFASDTDVSPFNVPVHTRRNDSVSTITGGTFITKKFDVALNHGMDMLHRAASLEALYDSADSFPQPKCHPETRKLILDRLFAWGMGCNSEYSQPSKTPAERQDPWANTTRPRPSQLDLSRNIRWLYGPAGAGKSAVMQTLAQRLQDSGRFGGSFFFKRGHPTRGNARALFVTLAYSLALHIAPWRIPILQIVENDPSILGRSIAVQLQKLIIEPCRSLEGCPPAMILIDGLDECEDHLVQQEILRSIGNAVRAPTLPVRFIIASRPELHIREVFEGPLLADTHLSCKVNRSFPDVERYLQEEFSRVHSEHWTTMATVPRPWPSNEVLNSLVSKSSGHFIYASTIIKFIDDKNFRPTERLSIVDDPDSGSSYDTPFNKLDRLYSEILSAAPLRQRFLPILLAILNFQLDLGELEELLGLQAGDACLAVRGLHSLLLVPPPSDDMAILQVHHQSFRDFLIDPTRSRPFFVDGVHQRVELAQSVLKLFSSGSTKDPSHTAWSLVSDGIHYITTSIPPSLDLIPVLSLFNPDLLWYQSWRPDSFHTGHLEAVTKGLVDWLKKIQPQPTSLIELWKDHHFILFCDSVTPSDFEQGPGDLTIKTCANILRAHPFLPRIFQGWNMLHTNTSSLRRPNFVEISHMLNISWEDTKIGLAALRSVIGEDKAKLAALFSFLDRFPTLRKDLCRTPATYQDLARGFMQMVKDILAAETLPDQFWPRGLDLAWLLRSSPRCPHLLPDLRDLTSRFGALRFHLLFPDPSEFFAFLRWLEVSLILLWISPPNY
ncbi:hypothetical protein DFH09DRAFT_1459652 [Mycena vulgaris]|nr:hypothetical protein DFH09DRAFT_1459652 [Mycena vulgaris]